MKGTTTIDAVDAMAGADTGADAVFLARFQLLDDIRISHMGTRHADHIDQAGGDGMARRRQLRNASRLEDRQVDDILDRFRQLKMRTCRHAHAGNDMRQGFIRIDMPLDHIDEVNET